MAEERVAIIGCGLIGGSLGLALRGSPGTVVTVYDSDPERAEAAVPRGIADVAAETIAEAVRDAEIVVVATPASSIADLAIEAAHAMSGGGIVTDVGSVKAPIVSAVEEHLPAGVDFLGGHPMAGSEQAGLDAARPELFAHASWVLTPTERSAPETVAAVSRMVRRVGASPLLLPPGVHDEVVATVSHLPHVIASALMNVATRHGADLPPVLALAAGGFRDVTRIAGGSPVVWEDILTENAAAVTDILDEFIGELEGFRASLDDRTRMHALLAEAQHARQALPIRVLEGDIWSVAVPVSDRPGEFAALATAVGEAGINVVDIELRHSPEGGRGVLHLSVTGRDAADRAEAVLRELGHHPHSEQVGT